MTDIVNDPAPQMSESDAADAPAQPEELDRRAWVTLGLFAALVVGGSGCFIGMFF